MNRGKNIHFQALREDTEVDLGCGFVRVLKEVFLKPFVPKEKRFYYRQLKK